MIKQIPVSDLRVGMFVNKLGGSWLDHPFWRGAFKVDSAAALKKVQDSGILEVWIDTAQGPDVAEPVAEAAIPDQVEHALVEDATLAEDDPPLPERVAMEREAARATKILGASMKAVTALFEQVRHGRALSVDQVMPMVDEIAESVLRNPGVLIALARLRRKDHYTYMHSIAVGALMVALGRQLGLPPRALREAGLAGLLHDIGKVHIEDALLNKPGRLEDHEFEVLRRHAHMGYETLQAGGGAEDAVLDVCRHHHERFDGTGYPDRLAGDNISLYARMAAVCDVYDATTSNRSYKVAWQPAYALRRMTEWRATQFDPAIFHAFVKTVGIYPTGTLVRLASNYLAVVLDQSGETLLTPRVKVFYSIPNKRRVPPRVVDLAQAPGERILGFEDPAAWGITDLENLWAGMNTGRK
ncbi:MAG: HD-GYP domain-containing protein [Pseudomonadota bacterium]